jgi:hypothetical protein
MKMGGVVEERGKEMKERDSDGWDVVCRGGNVVLKVCCCVVGV